LVKLEGRSLAWVAAGALGLWLGVHALRAFMTMLVWNVSEDASYEEMGGVAAGILVAGLLGPLAARIGGGSRPAWRAGVLFAVLSVVRQAVSDHYLTPALAFAACIVWLWWLWAFFREAQTESRSALVPLAAVFGLAGLIAGQAALHGLDLPMLVGPLPLAFLVLLAAAFLAGLRWSGPEPATTTSARWGPAALGPYLFLQLTLLANLGRVEALWGWDFPFAVLLAAFGLVAAGLGLAWVPARRIRIAVAVAVVLLLVAVPSQPPLIVPVQAGLALLLGSSFGHGRTPVYAAASAGAVLLFGLLFAYYAFEPAPLMWPLAGALVALPALGLHSGRRLRDLRMAAAPGVLAVAGLLVGLVPSARVAPASGPAPGTVTVLQYNVHQGISASGVPALESIADLIEGSGADLVALQEVNRGWDMSGGVDETAWLRWRFPDFQIAFGPDHSDLFGNAVMSRYPITSWGYELYPRFAPDDYPRGYTWASVAVNGRELLFVSTHLSGSPSDLGTQAPQTASLLRFAAGRGPAVFAGDYNDLPHEPGPRHLFDAGMREALTEAGMGNAFTFSSLKPEKRLDYVFLTPDIGVQSARVLPWVASDHSPVEAVLRLP
jgi:endonuclease/exonuclease/phosphatase family metal-dependent hydrolase